MLKKLFALSAVSCCSMAALQSQDVEPQNLPQKNRIAAIKKYLNDQGKVESVKKVKVNGSELLLIKYVLAPTFQSYIRCAVALPAEQVWTGRLIGLGNTGFPTQYPDNFYNWKEFTASTGVTAHLAGKNNAIATTDMGFSRHREKNPEVWKDFGFRATHLMTVTAKEIIRLY